MVTYGDSVDSYIEDVNSVICGRMHSRWIHYSTIDDPKTFSNNVNYCFTKLITSKQYDTRPIFSIFTTCYKSYEKIINDESISWELKEAIKFRMRRVL